MRRLQQDDLAYYQFLRLAGESCLRHGIFTRLGGVSDPPFASLNVGASVGDDPDAVAENRRRCFATLGLDESQVVTPHQVHGTTVAEVGKHERGRVIEATDGLITAETGVALFLRFADCVPIVLYDRERPAIGLVHAGWRGALDGILGQAIAAMRRNFGSEPGRLWAGIGPAIGPCCYEVAGDLAERFARRFGSEVIAKPTAGAWHLDLPRAVATALGEAGVREVERAQLCTACHCREFFSHRREQGRTGRFAAIISLVRG